MTRAFDPMLHEWWPDIVEGQAKPWARAAACMDLRWLASETRVRGRKFPSRPQLMARWGWTERRVRDLLAAPDEWQDPFFQMSVEELRPRLRRARGGPSLEGHASGRGVRAAAPTDAESRDGRSGVQRSSGASPNRVPNDKEERKESSENVPTSSRRRPGSGPKTSQVRPHARSYTQTPTTTQTAHTSTPSAEGGSAEQLATEAWVEEFRTAFGQEYAWRSRGRDSDRAQIKSWLEAAHVVPEAAHAGNARLRDGMRRYFEAVVAGIAWPRGQPAQTRHFTRDIAGWLQEPTAHQPRVPPSAGVRTKRSFSVRDLMEMHSQQPNHLVIDLEDTHGND